MTALDENLDPHEEEDEDEEIEIDVEEEEDGDEEETDGSESSDIAESTEVSEEDCSEGISSELEDDFDDVDANSEHLSGGSSNDTEYDNSNIWSEEEVDVENETKEATEASVMIDFQRSLDFILKGEHDQAKELFTKILEHPSVASYKTTNFIWENDATDNNHLNKMGCVFVAAHKNLAAIDEENAIQHYLQVVGVAPDNDEIWFALGEKLVQKGDLDMAIYAFERTKDWRAEDALMSTHFLRRNYKKVLELVCEREQRAGPFRKGNFLKKRIASMNEELNEYVRQLFGEGEGGDSFEVDAKYEEEVSSRLSILESKIQKCLDDCREEEIKMEEEEEPIKMSLSSGQSAWDIMTAFCDIFDRIQAYAEVYTQRIFIEEWECRDDMLIIENTVEGIVDDVVAVENTVQYLVEEIAMGNEKEMGVIANGRGRAKKVIEGKVKSRRGQKEDEKDREGRMGGESSCDEEDRQDRQDRPTSVDSVALREPSALEDVSTYYLDSRPIRPLREGMSATPSRLSATPGAIGSEEDLLTLLRESLYEERYLTVVKALEYALYCAVTMDCVPSRSSRASEILMQVYRRWTQSSSHLLLPHQLSIHAFMVMYDEPVAMDYCMRVAHTAYDESNDSRAMRFPEKRDLIRFVHKRVENISREEEGIKWLKFMVHTIGEEEAINVVGGVVSRDSVNEIIEKKERAARIRSLEHLRAEGKWEEIVSIVESDSEWNSVEDEDELNVRTRLYSKALAHMGRQEKAAEILNRMLFFLLSQPSLPSTTIDPWIKRLSSIDYSTIPSDSKILPSLGYSLLRLTEHTHLARDWKLWRLLHQVIKRIEESRPSLLGALLMESLAGNDHSRSEDYYELPLRSLRFLVHAHDRMASIGVCGQKNGAFLKYSLSEFREAMERKEVKEALDYRKFDWLISNVQAEIYQILHCLFGRYSKKKRAAEDHESGVELGEEGREEEGGEERKRTITKSMRNTIECAIAFTLPDPIPEFDDKGVGGSDVVDLISNRFPSLLRLNERRQRRVNELEMWIERGPVWKGELKQGETKDDKIKCLLVEWPHGGLDSKLESILFYLFSLHYHRQSKQEEARQFAQYFLSSNNVNSLETKMTKSAWIILSYATIERMFKLYDDDLLQEMDQHIRPLRVAMEISDQSDATVHFLLAQSLYQVSTRLSRHFERMSSMHPHQRQSVVFDLRRECVRLFKRVLELAPSMQEDNQSSWDFQWLAYFFLAKLHLKGDNSDVVKAVDSFYEAACALQMGGAVYLQKIPLKNQKNLEPVEVHYQLYSTVWKYITRTCNPPLDVLVRLRSYTDTMRRHGVVKPSTAIDLYECEPVISETMLNISLRAGRSHSESDQLFILNNTLDKVELIEELKTACKEAFKLVVDRFPHRKAFHRLAEMAMRDGDIPTAHSFIFKKIFPRKKKEDNIFEGVVEFTSTDIDRSDSLSFHVSRSLRLGLVVCVKSADASTISAVCTALSKMIVDEEESYVLKCSYLSMVRLATRCLSLVLASHPLQWNKTVKTELLSLYKSLVDVNESVPLVYLREEVSKIVDKMGGMDRLEVDVAAIERKPSQLRKRKTEERRGMLFGGLVGHSPAKMSHPSDSSDLPRPLATQPSRPSPQRQAIIDLCRSLNSSPVRASSSLPSLPSSSTSPISDPNRLLLHMLLQQAAAQSSSSNKNPNLYSNLFAKK